MGKALYNFIISKCSTVRQTRLHTIKKLILPQLTVSRQVNASGKIYEWSHFSNPV